MLIILSQLPYLLLVCDTRTEDDRLSGWLPSFGLNAKTRLYFVYIDVVSSRHNEYCNALINKGVVPQQKRAKIYNEVAGGYPAYSF